MQSVGVILVIALMIGPEIAAYLLVKELHQIMIVGGILGAIASVSGLYTSYYYDLPSGPAIALAVFVIFLLTLLFLCGSIPMLKPRHWRSGRQPANGCH